MVQSWRRHNFHILRLLLVQELLFNMQVPCTLVLGNHILFNNSTWVKFAIGTYSLYRLLRVKDSAFWMALFKTPPYPTLLQNNFFVAINHISTGFFCIFCPLDCFTSPWPLHSSFSNPLILCLPNPNASHCLYQLHFL